MLMQMLTFDVGSWYGSHAIYRLHHHIDEKTNLPCTPHTQMYATIYLDVSDNKKLSWNSGPMCHPFTVKSSP